MQLDYIRTLRFSDRRSHSTLEVNSLATGYLKSGSAERLRQCQCVLGRVMIRTARRKKKGKEGGIDVRALFVRRTVFERFTVGPDLTNSATPSHGPNTHQHQHVHSDSEYAVRLSLPPPSGPVPHFGVCTILRIVLYIVDTTMPAVDVFSRGDSLFLGFVSEHRSEGHVPNPYDVRHARVELVVDTMS